MLAQGGGGYRSPESSHTIPTTAPHAMHNSPLSALQRKRPTPVLKCPPRSPSNAHSTNRGRPHERSVLLALQPLPPPLFFPLEDSRGQWPVCAQMCSCGVGPARPHRHTPSTYAPQIWSASGDGTVCVWGLSGALVGQCKGHSKGVTGLATLQDRSVWGQGCAHAHAHAHAHTRLRL